MPFGARETLEAHEMLQELKIGIEHLAYYARHCSDRGLKSVLERHTDRMIGAYDRLRGYTHDYHAASGRPLPYERPNVSPQDIRYGLHNPQQIPLQESGRGGYPPEQLALYALNIHKNMARNAMAAALECADPNVRDILLNAANSCANEAYELFLALNAQGTYQVPSMHDHTAKTYLHPYQASDRAGADGERRFGTGQQHDVPAYSPYRSQEHQAQVHALDRQPL